MELSDKRFEGEVEFPRDKSKLQGSIAAEMQKWFDLAEARRRGLHESSRKIEELKADRDALAEEIRALTEQFTNTLASLGRGERPEVTLANKLDEAVEKQRHVPGCPAPEAGVWNCICSHLERIVAEKGGWETGGTKYDSEKPRQDKNDTFKQIVKELNNKVLSQESAITELLRTHELKMAYRDRTIQELRADRDTLAEEVQTLTEQLADELQRKKEQAPKVKTSPFSGMQCICLYCGKTYMGGNEDLHAAICGKKHGREVALGDKAHKEAIEQLERGEAPASQAEMYMQESLYWRAAEAGEEQGETLQQEGWDDLKKRGWEDGGTKYDSGKPRHDLIDPYAMDVLAQVLTFGAKKYAAHNWRKGIAYSRLIAAALRHINAINAGDDLDEETGLPHAAHAMCCMMFLTWMRAYRGDMDDRWVQETPAHPDDTITATPKTSKNLFTSDAPVRPASDMKSEDWQYKTFQTEAKKVVFKEYPGVTEERQKATEHADAIFSQYGIAPRAKQWVPFRIGDGTVVSTGDIIKLEGSRGMWRIKEIDAQNMKVSVVDLASLNLVAMVKVPMKNILAVQR